MAEVPVSIRIKGLVDGSVNTSVGKVKGEVKKLTADVVDTGSKIGVAFGGGSAAIVAMGAAAVTTAGKFEQLRSKLQALLKDSDAAQRSLELAVAMGGTTPFGVEGIVSATVQLTAYGLRANTVLREVSDLAAAMGTDIESAAMAVGKAASGSAEGFQSLRDTYALTTAELVKFGAEANNAGGVLVQTPPQIEKARNALLKLIEVKFGGSAEAQSATFAGAMNNLGDAVELAMVKVGDAILPTATMLANFAGDVIGKFQAVPNGLVAVGAGIAAITAGIGAFISAVTLAGAAMVSWYAALQAAAPQSALAAATIDRLSASYTRLAGSMTAAQAAAAKWRTSLGFVGGAIGLATGAYALASLGLYAYERAAKAADEAITSQAKKLTDAASKWRLYRDAINEAAQGAGVSVDRGASIGETAQQLSQMSKGNRSAFVSGLESRGINLEDSRKELADAEDRMPRLRTQFLEARRLMQGLAEEYQKGQKISLSWLERSDLPSSQIQFLKEAFPEASHVTIDQIAKKVNEFKLEMEDVGRTAEGARAAVKAFESFAVPLQEAIDKAKSLDTYLQFTKSSKDLPTLTTRLAHVTQEVRALESAARDQGLPTTMQGLQRELLTASGTRLEFVKTFLSTLEQQGAAEKDLAAQVAAAEQSKLTEIERTQARRRAAGEDSTRDELRFAKERLAAVEGAAKKEENVLAQLAELRGLKRKQPELSGLDERIRQLEAELEGVRRLADEEVKARTDVRDRSKKLAEEQANNAKKALQDQTDAAKKAVSEFRAAETGDVRATASELARISVGLDNWEAKNKTLLASSRELRRELAAARREVEQQGVQIREKAQAERLEGIKQKVTIDVADAEGTKAKLDVIRGAMSQLNAERTRGLLDAKASQAELTRLKREELQLSKQLTSEEAAKAATMAGIKTGDLQSEIEYLKARQAAGENVTWELQQKEKELLQARLDAINATAEAELAANQDREVVEARRVAAIKALLREEASTRFNLHKETYAAIDAEDARRQGRGSSTSGSGLGAPGTISDQGYSSGIGTSPLSSGRQIRRQKQIRVPTPDQVAQQMGINTGAQARYEKLTSQGFDVAAPVSKDQEREQRSRINGRDATPLSEEQRQEQTKTINDNRQVTLNMSIEGGAMASRDLDRNSPAGRAILALIEDEFKHQGWRDGGQGSWA